MPVEEPILHLALPTPLRRLFDYLPPHDIDFQKLMPGLRITVPFQSRTLVGIIDNISNSSTFPKHKLKRAIALIDEVPLFPDDIYKLCRWTAQYYHHGLGDILANALPVGLRRGQILMAPPPTKVASVTPDVTPPLNEAQTVALQSITACLHQFNVFLLNGITGSGKTEVYLRTIEQVLSINKQILVLVPEISLTPQTLARFQSRFAIPIVAYHSNLSEKKRLQAWSAAKSGEAKIVIGTRSAIFIPFAQLGLIVVDEEHDHSFKQQDRLRYHARDLAVMRAQFNGIPIILGSATPALESLHNAQSQRYRALTLPERAGGAVLPNIELIDTRQCSVDAGLSAPLLQAMTAHLAEKQHVMIFLNRRGFSPVFYCTACHWIAICPRCEARLVYHQQPLHLQCHHCDKQYPISTECKECHGNTLQAVGLGTQRLEAALAQHFPNTPIFRVDRDNTRRKNALSYLFSEIQAAEQGAILLGTQMLAKGHHFPKVTLVGIVNTDSGLFSADFRAAEQLGQLLVQVSGRAGREMQQGTVMIQTRHPDHPLLQTLIEQGYQTFATTLLQERQQAHLPPYAYFAIIRAESYNEKKVMDFLSHIKMGIKHTAFVSIMGPLPAMLHKRKGLHCYQLLIKATKRSQLHAYLRNTIEKVDTLPSKKTVKWIVDVDPVELW